MRAPNQQTSKNKGEAKMRKKISTARAFVVATASVFLSALYGMPAWGASGVLGQAGQQACPPCPSQGFLTGTAGYAVRWLLVLALFAGSMALAFALGRSRKRAEES
jgi:hypothetical protein